MDKKGNYRHGGRHTRLYNIWRCMRQRCYNPNASRHQNYYDKGIKVCDEWQSFLAFREWALQNGYRDDLSIDRIDVNGNYEPSNCRWADQITQQNNRTSNHIIVYKGESHTICEWARIKGINSATLWARINVSKWDIERALNE